MAQAEIQEEMVGSGRQRRRAGGTGERLVPTHSRNPEVVDGVSFWLLSVVLSFSSAHN